MGAFVSLALAVAGFISLGLFFRSSPGNLGGGVFAGTIVAVFAFSGFVVLGFPRYTAQQGLASPLRVGWSGSGIQVEYDPAHQRTLDRTGWAFQFAPWATIASIDASRAGWPTPNELSIKDRSQPPRELRIVQISQEIVDRLRAEWTRRSGPLLG